MTTIHGQAIDIWLLLVGSLIGIYAVLHFVAAGYGLAEAIWGDAARVSWRNLALIISVAAALMAGSAVIMDLAIK